MHICGWHVLCPPNKAHATLTHHEVLRLRDLHELSPKTLAVTAVQIVSALLVSEASFGGVVLWLHN